MSETRENGDPVETIKKSQTHYVLQMFVGERSTGEQCYGPQHSIVVVGNQYFVYGNGLDIRGISQATTTEEIFQEAYAKLCDELNERFAKDDPDLYVSKGTVLSSRRIL